MDEKQKVFVYGLRTVIRQKIKKTGDTVNKGQLRTIDAVIDGLNIIEDMSLEEVQKLMKKMEGEI
jgi:hypothetical protein